MGWCKKHQLHVVGVEADDRLIRRARAAGYEAYGSLLDLREANSTQFDLVVAFDVLEHIQEDRLPEMLAQIRLILRDNGFLVARFPNGASPFGRKYQYSDLTHVAVLSAEKMECYGRSAGFAMTTAKAPATSLSCGPLRMLKRLAAMGVRWCIDRIVRFAYYADAAGPLSPNVVIALQARGAAFQGNKENDAAVNDT